MFITKEYLRENQNCIFVYGDNTIHKGTGGAAKLRYEPNTYGFVTKKYPSNEISSFFTIEEYLPVFEKEMQKLIKKIESNPDKIFLISKLGSGLANRYGIFEQIIFPGLKRLAIYKNVKFLF